MNKYTRTLRVLKVLNAAIFICSGGLIFYSIFQGSNRWWINFVVGMIFCLFGIFIANKHGSILTLAKDYQVNKIDTTKYLKKVLVYEIALSVILLSFGILLGSGIFRRAIIELLPIFD